MTRTFQHRFTLSSKCGILLFAGLALYLFWVKAVVFGLLFVVLNVMLLERVLHSRYTITDDGLTVYRGRFAKSHTIPLTHIRYCTAMRSTFGLSRYLLLEYGEHGCIALEPAQEAAFMDCLAKRMRKHPALHVAHGDDEG